MLIVINTKVYPIIFHRSLLCPFLASATSNDSQTPTTYHRDVESFIKLNQLIKHQEQALGFQGCTPSGLRVLAACL